MFWIRLIIAGLVFFPSLGLLPRASFAGDKGPHLARAVMCESLADYVPHRVAVVFSIEVGRIFCFTEFDSVPAKTFVYHKWFRRDQLVTTKRLTLKPPRWSSYSSIQLREADKGPWRVEITDRKGALLHVLRFSVTD